MIKGALPVLKLGRVDFIYAEVIPEALLEAGSSVEEFASLLDEAGFEPVTLNHSQHQLESVSFAAAMETAGMRRNLLFRYRNL